MLCWQAEEQRENDAMSSSTLGELISCGLGATLAALLLEPTSDMTLMTAAALLLAHLLRVPGDNPGRSMLLQALHDADGCISIPIRIDRVLLPAAGILNMYRRLACVCAGWCRTCWRW